MVMEVEVYNRVRSMNNYLQHFSINLDLEDDLTRRRRRHCVTAVAVIGAAMFLYCGYVLLMRI